MMPDMAAILKEIEAELQVMKWQSANHLNVGTHYTGRGPKWTLQLICLNASSGGLRMGAATAGSVVMKLTDALAEKAEASARAARP